MRRFLVSLLTICPLLAATPPHPRLYFPAGAEAPLKQRIKSDKLAGQLHDASMKRADRILTEESVVYEIPDGLRLLKQSRNAINRILHTAYAWRMTGEQKYFDRCVKELDTACALPDWNPKHFLDVGEMATAVAIGYDWLYPKLTTEQRKRYEEALATKAIDPVKTNAKAWWIKPTNNWTQVCNAGLMIAADALRDVRPDLAGPTLESTRKLIKECEIFYKPDGAYPEGPSYWHYGTSYHVLAMALEERDAPRKLDPIWQKTGRFLIHATGPCGMTFNFADAPPGQAETSPAQTWLATRTGDALAISSTRELLTRRYSEKKTPNDRFLPLTLLWLPQEKKAPQPELQAVFHGEQELAFFRTSWDKDALWLGIKGGTAAASHGQMDAGSFVLDWAGSRWIHDLGPDDYNLPAYFGNKRFTYFRMQNLSHNTIAIGDALQNAKAEPCTMTDLGTQGSSATTTIDLTHAYLDQCTKATRSVTFDKSKRSIQLTDRVTSPKGNVSWRAVTDAKISISGNVATLEKDDHKLVFTSADKSLTWKTNAATPPTDKEKPNTGFQILSLEAPKAAETTLQIRIDASK